MFYFRAWLRRRSFTLVHLFCNTRACNVAGEICMLGWRRIDNMLLQDDIRCKGTAAQQRGLEQWGDVSERPDLMLLQMEGVSLSCILSLSLSFSTSDLFALCLPLSISPLFPLSLSLSSRHLSLYFSVQILDKTLSMALLLARP